MTGTGTMFSLQCLISPFLQEMIHIEPNNHWLMIIYSSLQSQLIPDKPPLHAINLQAAWCRCVSVSGDVYAISQSS